MEEDKKRKLEEINKDMAVGVFDAEVEERVSVMRVELESLCESMRSTISLELKRVCFSPFSLVSSRLTSLFSCLIKFER